jgi:SIR2-like domain
MATSTRKAASDKEPAAKTVGPVTVIGSPDCGCAYCKSEKGFSFPRDLLDRIVAGDVVVFAGAGISTENPINCTTTFYEDIRQELGESRDLDFPSLMDEYCSQPDGRIKLITKIKERIDYFCSFRGFRAPMTRFHRSILPLHMISDIITTNWDNLFEEEAGFTPFVYDQDVALLRGTKRRVVKIHGSITNFGSIVATSKDYQTAFKRLTKGPLGAHLKNLISTKTIIYTGYSLRDPNYLKIAKVISKMMGNFSRQSYFISPNIDRDYLSKTKLNLIPLETDGSYFFEQFRRHHINSCGCIVSEEAFNDCYELLSLVNMIHEDTANKFQSRKSRLLILALSYQDGLQDALMRIADRRNSGEYYDAQHVRNLIGGYESKVGAYRRKGNLWDACYSRGYQNGLLYLLSGGGSVSPPSVDLIFDEKIDTVGKALRYPQKRLPPRVSKELDRLAKWIARDGLIPEHLPYV